MHAGGTGRGIALANPGGGVWDRTVPLDHPVGSSGKGGSHTMVPQRGRVLGAQTGRGELELGL